MPAGSVRPLNADGLLCDARVYLSGPMDFVASRKAEKQTGWRTRVGEVLRKMGVIVFDPWEKPDVRGLHEYGREGETTTSKRSEWTYDQGDDGHRIRAAVSEAFWPALHIDLRMVDTSDFVICYCPTNIYSVGTPHEIVVARQQRKPVLFVSPYVRFDALEKLRTHLASDSIGRAFLEELVAEVPIKENLNASPSLWYMPLVGGYHFFDGFGFDEFRDEFGWDEISDLDRRERRAGTQPRNPLLRFLSRLNRELPKKWDRATQKMVPNDDWLLWDFKKDPKNPGAQVEDTKENQSK